MHRYQIKSQHTIDQEQQKDPWEYFDQPTDYTDNKESLLAITQRQEEDEATQQPHQTQAPRHKIFKGIKQHSTDNQIAKKNRAMHAWPDQSSQIQQLR